MANLAGLVLPIANDAILALILVEEDVLLAATWPTQRPSTLAIQSQLVPNQLGSFKLLLDYLRQAGYQ